MTRYMKTAASSRRSGRGFSIIEVLATLVLVGLVLPVAVDGILLSLATAGYARNQARAMALAQNIMTEMVAAADYQDAQATGRFEPIGPEYEWTAQWNDWDDPRLMQLTVTVVWQQRSEQREVAVSTLAPSGRGG